MTTAPIEFPPPVDPDTETTSLPWFLNGGGGGMRIERLEVGVR